MLITFTHHDHIKAVSMTFLRSITRAAAWTALVSGVLLLAAWVLTGWWTVGLSFRKGELVLSSGILYFECQNKDPKTWYPPLGLTAKYNPKPIWSNQFKAGAVPHVVWLVAPLWLPAAAIIICGGGALRLWPRRLLGHCSACHYDRRGIPPSTPCPECGTTPKPTNPQT